MKRFKKKFPLISSKKEALQLKPVKKRDISEYQLKNGNIQLVYPILPSPLIFFFLKFLRYEKIHTKNRKIQLDALGSFTWQLMDGNRTVQEIIHEFSQKYGLLDIEAEISITHFIRLLGQRGLVGLSDH